MKKYKISGLKVSAAWQVDFSTAPNDFEYMPQGTHIISCLVEGKAQEISVTCDESTTDVFQRSLDEVNALYDKGEISRPFIDFDHQQGEAAAFPKRFFWKDGLRLEVEWTDAGRRAVEEKRYNYCSPTFCVDVATGMPTGINYPGAIGALVNVPAFQSIQKISAKLTETKGDKQMEKDNEPKNTPDKPTPEELEKQLKDKDAEIAALKAQLEDTGKGSEGGEGDPKKEGKPDNNPDNKDKELEQLKAKVAELEKEKQDADQKAECARKEAIEQKVDELVKAGRIKPEGKDAFVAMAMLAKDNGKALFDGLPESEDQPLTVNAKAQPKANDGLTGVARAAAAFNKILNK